MTLHVVLPTGDGKQLAWVTDKSAVFGRGNTSGIRKVEYLEKQKVACSSWGDFVGADVVDRFAKRCEAGAVDPSDARAVTSSIKDVGQEVLGEIPKDERAQRYRAEKEQGHGVIVATFYDPLRLYLAFIGRNTICREVTEEIIAGDFYNPARIFPYYYFPLTSKTLTDAICVGVHSIRLANKLRSEIVGDPVVWVYDGDKFRQMDSIELGTYTKASISLDSMILDKLGHR